MSAVLLSAPTSLPHRMEHPALPHMSPSYNEFVDMASYDYDQGIASCSLTPSDVKRRLRALFAKDDISEQEATPWS